MLPSMLHIHSITGWFRMSRIQFPFHLKSALTALKLPLLLEHLAKDLWFVGAEVAERYPKILKVIYHTQVTPKIIWGICMNTDEAGMGHLIKWNRSLFSNGILQQVSRSYWRAIDSVHWGSFRISAFRTSRGQGSRTAETGFRTVQKLGQHRWLSCPKHPWR